MDININENREYIFEGKAAISQTDLDGNITFVNRKFCEISGYSVDELIGKNHNIVRHPEVQDEVFEKMYKTIKSAQVWSGVLKNLRKDGDYYLANIEITPILDEDSNITGFISISRSSSRKNIHDY